MFNHDWLFIEIALLFALYLTFIIKYSYYSRLSPRLCFEKLVFRYIVRIYISAFSFFNSFSFFLYLQFSFSLFLAFISYVYHFTNSQCQSLVKYVKAYAAINGILIYSCNLFSIEPLRSFVVENVLNIHLCTLPELPIEIKTDKEMA